MNADASDTAAVWQLAVTRATAAVSIACSCLWATGTAAVPRSKETGDMAAVSLAPVTRDTVAVDYSTDGSTDHNPYHW